MIECILSFIGRHEGAWTALATIVIALFTIALVIVSWCQSRLIGRQIALTQAQFDQWVVLINWRVVEKPKNNRLKVRVDLMNPTGYPMIIDGKIAIGDEVRGFGNTFLSPNDPKTAEFNIALTDGIYELSAFVSAPFVHHHKISKKPITQDLGGVLLFQWFGGDHNWHVSFTAVTAEEKEKYREAKNETSATK